jgi:lysophospholipase L1-like esterase
MLGDSANAWLSGWRPSSAVAWVVLGLAAVWLISIASLFLLAAGRRFFARRSMGLVLAVGSLLGSLSLMEARVSRLAPAWAGPVRFPSLRKTFEPEADGFPGVRGPSNFTTNRVGWRGADWPPPPDGLRILCLGGGATEGLYLDDEETWPHQLENQLRDRGFAQTPWVASAGYGGVTVDRLADWAQGTSLLEPIDVVLCLVGAEEVVVELLRTPPTPEAPSAPQWQQTSLARLLLRLSDGPPTQLFPCDPAGSQHRAAQGSLPARSKDRVSVRAIDQYMDHLARLTDTLTQRGKRVILVTHPSLWDDFMFELFERRLRYCRGDATPEGVDKPTPSLARATLDQFNQRMFEWCQDRSIECFDIAPSMDGRADYFYDDFHFSEEGARQIARRLADYLIEHPKPSQRTNSLPSTIRRPTFLPPQTRTVLTFRARSNRPTTAEATIGPADNNGVPASFNKSFDLGTQWQRYVWALEPAEPIGSADFSLATPPELAIEVSSFAPLRQLHPLRWHVHAHPPAESSAVSLAPDANNPLAQYVAFEKKDPGLINAITLESQLVTLVRGLRYQLSIRGQADQPRSLTLQLRSEDSPPRQIDLGADLRLGSEEVTLTREFIVAEDLEDVRVVMAIGREPVPFRLLATSLRVVVEEQNVDRGRSAKPSP